MIPTPESAQPTGDEAIGCDHFAARVRTSFARQGLMRTLGATIQTVEPGAVEIAMLPRPEVSQQHGFVHAGAISAIADNAAGYAALSLMRAGNAIMTVEFKINFLAPAKGDRILAVGKAIKSGRTLSFAHADVFAETGGRSKLVATLASTLIGVEGRGLTD